MSTHSNSIGASREPSDHHEAIDSFTRCYVRKQARQLVGKRGFRAADREDIEQQLYLKLIPYLRQADPDSPSWKAFVAKTVAHQIVNMIRHNERERRDHRRVCSIHVLVPGENSKPVEMAGNLLESETPGRRGRVSLTEQEIADLRIDLDACIEQLGDPRFREFCERLKRDSIAQIASDMGIPRTTVNSWLVKVRAHFQEHGLSRSSRKHRQLADQRGS